MSKPKRVRVKVAVDGLSPATAKKVETYLAKTIGDELGKASSGKVVPRSGFPKFILLVASGFGKRVLAPVRPDRKSPGK